MTWPTKTDFVDGDVLTAAQVNNIGTNLNLFDPTSATSGQVPIADGLGSIAFGTPAAGGMTLIDSGALDGLSTFTISAIPQTYLHLQLVLWNVYASTTSLYPRFAPNGVNVGDRIMMYSSSSAGNTFVSGANSSASTGNFMGDLAYMSNNSNYRNTYFATFYNYARALDGTDEYRPAMLVARGNAPTDYTDRRTGISIGTSKTTEITSLTVNIVGSGTWTDGDYYLYGVK